VARELRQKTERLWKRYDRWVKAHYKTLDITIRAMPYVLGVLAGLYASGLYVFAMLTH
jgi:hypothetical protein